LIDLAILTALAKVLKWISKQLFRVLIINLKHMNLKPLNDHLIVKPLSREAVTKSGIFLPETADKERPEQGEVIAIGTGRLLENGNLVPMSVKVGDKIVFKKYSPDEIKIDNQDFLVLRDGDVIAIIE
jgi:chaperonin GroES